MKQTQSAAAVLATVAMALSVLTAWAQNAAPVAAPTAAPAATGFVLRSPDVADGGTLPTDYTGDGSSATLPLEWSGAPAGTRSYAVIMHHVDPEGKTKWYWVLYGIPVTTQSLPRNVRNVGVLGNNSVNGRTEYAPPHSKGPGLKRYIYTVYALSAAPQVSVAPERVSREVLLTAMKDCTLATAELRVVYSRPPGATSDRDRDREPATVLPPAVEALRRLSVVLGRPTAAAVNLNLLANEPLDVWVEYGTAPGRYETRTAAVSLQSGKPAELTLAGLRPDTAYVYRLRSRQPGTAAEFDAGTEHGFHTQRAPGRTFSFELQGDSHPERPHQFDPTLYAQTLRAAAADHPDFYVTLGDDSSVDALRAVTAETVGAAYLNQRLYLGLVGASAPVFLVNGNHEQAARCNLDGTANNVAVWAQSARNSFFAEPAPDGFYTGDGQSVEHIGLVRDYYAWAWGDALFVVIDPYWHSTQPVDNAFSGGPKIRDLWAITLGGEQYQWLKKTLESSQARYKFVFTHHVLGTGRGGIEQAGLFEWGGRNRRGEDEFRQRRPGWELPIHPLLAKNGVTIVFQGHDHVFVRQQLDGVVYQTLALPADPN